jgi:predicted permease
MNTMLQDLRFALRSFARSPGFAALALATLTLGIGATTAVYSVLRAVVLQPLPYAAPERLVRLMATTPQGDDFAVSVPDFRDFRQGARSFRGLVALADREVALLGGGEPTRLTGVAASEGWFELLGVRPALGRAPVAADFASGADVAVLSDRAWRKHFGGNPAVLGRKVDLAGAPAIVVGVMPRGFESPGDPDLWLPLRLDPQAEREDHDLAVVARLADGVDVGAATAELRGIATRLGAQFPETNGGWGVRLVPLRDWLVPPQVERTVWLLMVGVALLLLLTCANVSNLLLGRAVERRREIGVRAALGAGRARLARQLLTESVLLAALGAAGGALLATWVVPLLPRLLPPDIPHADAIAIDGGVLAFAALVAGLTALVFGFAPALAASASGIREAAAGLRTTGTRSRTRDALVVAELALAMTLLIGAGLLVSSFLRLQRADLGLDSSERLVAVPLALPQGRPQGQLARLLLAIEERVAAVPGVVAVGASNVTPLSGGSTAIDLAVEGRPSGPGETRSARWRSVTPGFFRATSVGLLRGRALRPADYAPDAEAVVVVTAALARDLFGKEDPIGRRIAMGVHGDNWRRIVGISEDVRDVALAEPPQPTFFMPELGWPWMTLLLRVERDPGTLAAPIRQAIWELDADLPVPTVEPMSARVATAVLRPRFQMVVMACFALVALLLAAVGIYGVISQLVASQTREIGVRLALGAAPARILRLVLARGASLVGAGLLLGAAASFALTRTMGSLLFETEPADPLTFLAVAGVLAVVGLASVLLPARRAARVEPLRALRAD